MAPTAASAVSTSTITFTTTSGTAYEMVTFWQLINNESQPVEVVVYDNSRGRAYIADEMGGSLPDNPISGVPFIFHHSLGRLVTTPVLSAYDDRYEDESGR